MGQDKALLKIDSPRGDQTLLTYMIDKLKALSEFDEFVVCRNEVDYLQDIKPGLGPLGALHTLGENYRNYRALIIPVDMPLLNIKESRTQLFEYLDNNNSTACYFDNLLFPLAIIFNETVNKELKNRVVNSREDLSIASFLRAIDAQKRPLPHAENNKQFSNINSPEDWKNFLHAGKDTFL